MNVVSLLPSFPPPRGPQWTTGAVSAVIVAQQREPSCTLLALKEESEGRFFGPILLLFIVLLCFRCMLPATFCVRFPVSDADRSQGLRSLISSINLQCSCSLQSGCPLFVLSWLLALSKCTSFCCLVVLVLLVLLILLVLDHLRAQSKHCKEPLERTPITTTLVSDVANYHRSAPPNHLLLPHTQINISTG